MAQQTGAIYHQGILYSGGGGTNVTPNPQGEATDTLNTVEIDGTVYGIEGGGGSNLIIDAQRYSLEEKVVGIWTDGKPLYQRTWEFSNSVSLSANIWFTSSIPNTNMERIVNVEAMSETGTRWTISGARDEGSYVNLICFRNSAITVKYVTLQYTKTTDTAGSGGYQAYGFSPIIYSDVEREVGVWRDNKPLYQKTIHIPSLPSTAYTITTYPHGIQDIDTICGWDSIVRWSTGAIRIIPSTQYVNRSENIAGCFDATITKTGIEIWVGQDRTALNGDFTIWYTKTTDVAGSGEYNTLAIPNVHYSTDEQVIGTWIDGKTLYQRTWQTTAVTGRVVDLSGVNVEKVIYQDAFIMSSDGNNITPHGGESFVIWNRTATSAANPNNCIMCTINNSSYNNGTMYVTLQYTKTTD